MDAAPTILAATGVNQTHATLDGHDILSGHTRQQALLEYPDTALLTESLRAAR